MNQRILNIVLLLGLVSLPSCAPAPILPESDSGSWDEVVLLIDDVSAKVSVPISKLQGLIDNPIELSREQLADRGFGLEKGAVFPVILNFDQRRKDNGNRMQSDFSVRVGVDMVPGVNLFSRSPQDALDKMEADFWAMFDDSKESSKYWKELHRKSFHKYEIYESEGRVWERNFSEGVLSSVYDLYRTPLVHDIYLNMVFVYDRQRWKTDKSWFASRQLIVQKIIDSVSIE
ncbi:hypothetical protein [Elongatibacter sediminis]|uniref:Lipoprotein n=1 Tax=Elongatibacter sediminis TaxID=3119006 RepID=A0AAW9RJ70_9GAMM